ncbi:MAG: DUF2235 domain-containing protein [Nitrospira sp.]|nr:DUF2235 domain-containing protein [Nitrospira sp.]
MGRKTIVLCSDGTGKEAIKFRGSNVLKLSDAVDIRGHKYDSSLTPQLVLHGDGVGTGQSALDKLIGGAFGYGFGKNVKELYIALCNVYEPGDRIYCFGFSRGAYTIQVLAGLIQYCGVLDFKKISEDSLKRRVDCCWRDFSRQAFKHALPKNRYNNELDTDSIKPDRVRREAYGAIIDDEHVPDGKVPIEFLGVWDTVRALGMPFKKLHSVLNLCHPMRFPRMPSSQIKRACHALSIDDNRQSFHPELWNEKGCATHVEQVWFAGVHSNVGGGYEREGMSLVALDWMMTEAEKSGLRFTLVNREYVRTNQDVHDRLYDARAGLGVYYRWEPRNIAKLCQEHHIDLPKIHVSVIERIANSAGGYAPVNIPYQFQVVGTEDGRGWPADKILRDIEKRLVHVEEQRAGHELNGSLLDGMTRTVKNGQVSYYIFVTVSILAVGWWNDLAPFPEAVGVLSQWCPHPSRVIGVAIACIGWLVWRWALLVDRRMASVGRSYWQPYSNELRKFLMDRG